MTESHEIQIFSKKKNRWIWVDEVLADTGADFCMLPRYLGNFFVEDITTGKYVEIKGVVPGARLIAYIHNLKIKIADRELEAYVAIADSDDVPALFGRVKGLDEFDASFLEGEKIKFHWE
jgi:predicted aspartyl protease